MPQFAYKAMQHNGVLTEGFLDASNRQEAMRQVEGRGLKPIKLADVKGKPTIISVVPSLDTAVCAMQTKKFNDQLGTLGDKINALTVSLDLPFAMNRFCGAENIKNMRVGSDYQDRNFGENWGTLIEELKIECRAVFVLEPNGKVIHAEYVNEVTSEPDYDAAMEALRSKL